MNETIKKTMILTGKRGRSINFSSYTPLDEILQMLIDLKTDCENENLEAYSVFDEFIAFNTEKRKD